jgi:hypothetical protein
MHPTPPLVTAQAGVLGMPPQEVTAQTLRGLANSKKLAEAMRKHEPVAREMATNMLVEQIAERMSPDIRGELLSAWGKYGDLAEAARSTKGNPGASEDVSLATQVVTSVHPYSVQVKVNGIPFDELRVEVKFVFTLAQLFGRVRGGRLVALVVDKSELLVAATLMGEPIFSTTFAINLHAELNLGDGVPLIRD